MLSSTGFLSIMFWFQLRGLLKFLAMLCIQANPKFFLFFPQSFKSDLNQTFAAYKIVWGLNKLLAESEHCKLLDAL